MALTISGKASWFGGPHDPGAGGAPAWGRGWSQPLIAVYNQGTKAGYWRVTAPNGTTRTVVQGDIGPAPRTGRVIDIGFNALHLFGYNEGNFPTDQGTWRAQYLGKNAPKQGAQAAPAGGTRTMLPGVPAPGHLQTQTQFDQPGFDQAVKSFRVGSFLAGQGQAKDNPLFLSGLLSTTAPSTQDFTQSFQRFVPGAAGRPTAVRGQPTGGGGWVHPIAGMQPGWQGRIDNGVDYETRPGTALRAVGSGKVVNLNGAFPGGSIVIKLDRPFNGHQYVYYGHLNGNKLVRVGQRVNAGQTVARSSANPSGANTPGHVEIGFARGPEGVIFLGGHAPGPTPWGQAFNTLATKYARR